MEQPELWANDVATFSRGYKEIRAKTHSPSSRLNPGQVGLQFVIAALESPKI